MDSRKVLTHLIKAGRDALHLEKTLQDLGYKETPYYNLYGEISDAIYTMIGEETDSFDESITYSVMHDPLYTDAECAEELAKLVDVENALDVLLPGSTKDILKESAKKLGVEPSALARVIMNNWAMNEMQREFAGR